MAINSGQSGEFNHQTGSIIIYIERVCLFFRASDIKAPKQVLPNLFFASVDTSTGMGLVYSLF